MGEQKTAFWQGEGDAWYGRNRGQLSPAADRAQRDPVLRTVTGWPEPPSNIAEIGASDGWRLEALRRATGAQCRGVEPSAEAVAAGQAAYPDIALARGTADSLPWPDSAVDLVILGFCLYLCDREDLFRIAAEVDRVLADGGRVIVWDFYAEIPYRQPYRHVPGTYSYKMDYSKLFTWNPAYRLVQHWVTDHAGGDGRDPEDRLALTVLAKAVYQGWPDKPSWPQQSEAG